MSSTCRIYNLKRPTESFGILAWQINIRLCCGFFFTPLPLPPSSSSLILIFRVLHHSLILLLAMGSTERNDRWWERGPHPCKSFASLLLEQAMCGRHLPHYSHPFLFSSGRMGLAGWVLTSANVSLSSHGSFSNSSLGICKAGLPLHAFLQASKDIHLLCWWSDDYSSKEGDESDNLEIKSENSSYSTVMELKNQAGEGLQCKNSTSLVVWCA